MADTTNQNLQGLSAEDSSGAGKGLGLTIGAIAIILGIFNLSFIVPSLVYAYEGTTCVNTLVDGISFTLSTWLQVDAYMRIGVVGILLIAAIASCISLNLGVKMFVCVICLILFYSLFQLAWMIVGSVLFWGKLNPIGVCSGGVQAYMYALLIISYIAICCNCLYSFKSRNNQ